MSLRRASASDLLLAAAAAIVLALLVVDVLRELAGIFVQLVGAAPPAGYRDAYADAPLTLEVGNRVVQYGGLLASIVALALAVGALFAGLRFLPRLKRAR